MEFVRVEVMSDLVKLLGNGDYSVEDGVKIRYESEDGNQFVIWRRDLPLNGKWFYRVDKVDGSTPYSGFADDEELVGEYKRFLENF